MIEVRAAVARDADALGEVHAESWQAAYGSLFQTEFTARSVAARRGRWHHRIDEAVGPILLAELDHRPLALSFSVPSTTMPHLAEIYSFYGHPDGWGSGVAAALMVETLRVLRADGNTDAHLWTLKSTVQSRRCYAKCGFAESGAERACDFGDGRLFEQVEYRRPLRSSS